jgi:hypothetical protein
VEAVKRLVSRCGARIPGNLAVFVAAIFLSYGVIAFSTIYTVPGHPSHSLRLWISFASSMLAAGLWTALAAKKDGIDKAALSGRGDSDQREITRMEMWRDVWLKTLLYFGGGAVFSLLALLVLIFP